MLLTFRNIQVVQAVMDTRSISMAATRLNVSQPALTKALQSLEEGIGARVFDRGAGGISPTPYALAILSHSGEINSGLSKIEREIALLKNNDASLFLSSAISRSILLKPELISPEWLKIASA